MIRILSTSLSLFVLALLAHPVQASATYDIDIQGTGGPDNHFLRVAGTITLEPVDGDLIISGIEDVVTDSSLLYYHDSDDPVLLTLVSDRFTDFEEDMGMLFLAGTQIGKGLVWTVPGNEFANFVIPRYTYFMLDENGIATVTYDHRTRETIDMDGFSGPTDTSAIDQLVLGSFGQRLKIGNRVETIDPDPSAVPEPSSIATWLILAGFVVGIRIMRRRSQWLSSLR